MNVGLPEKLSRLGIDELDLSVRSYNALKSNGIKTLGQLVLLSDEELLKFHAFGRKRLMDVRRAIAAALSSHAGEVHEQQAPNAAQGAQADRPHSESDVDLSAGGWKVPHHSAGDLDAPVDVLDLSTRAFNVLKHLQVRSVHQLLSFPKEALLRAENMGRKSLAEIAMKLFTYLSGGSQPALEHQRSREPSANQLAGTKALIENMLARLPERQQGVIADRYGLWDGIAETLQDIGDKLGVTRERIRQIEATGLRRLRRVFGHQAVKDFVLQKLSIYLASEPDKTCGILSEDEAAAALADDCSAEEAALAASFLQDLDAPGQSVFARHLIEVEPGIYCTENGVAAECRVLLELIESTLQQHQKPLSERRLYDDLANRSAGPLTPRQVARIGRLLAISPSVMRLRNGTIAFSKWTEFRRRDSTSLVEATLRLLGRPGHFREITQKIGSLFRDAGSVNERTIHNAIIREQRKFVWVKSGTYGLAAWGLKRPPFIKDRLVELLSESLYPLPFWHLKEKVLEVCNCREDSVRMTLDLNPRLFKKFEGDQYGLRKHFDE